MKLARVSNMLNLLATTELIAIALDLAICTMYSYIVCRYYYHHVYWKDYTKGGSMHVHTMLLLYSLIKLLSAVVLLR